MRIALVTDAWAPQINGVVRTLTTICEELRRRGHQAEVISPDLYRSLPCPTYPEIRRRWCLARARAFTTAYHTQFPDYLARRTGLSPALFWPYIRRFHGASAAIMVATETIRAQLRAHGLDRLRPWSRGVDLANFGPTVAPPDLFFGLPRPIQLYVGRVAVEKNIEAFLRNGHPGAKVVVGDGPALARLQARFPEAHFLGKQTGLALAACYAGADVFVFPSRTDTFGLVMIEALACGTPVAAFPVAGPLDVLTPESGALSERLEDAIAAALALDRDRCLVHGRSFSWEASTDQFLAALEPIASSRPIPTALAAVA